MPKVFQMTRTPRCWVHKTANVLNKPPRKLHPEGKRRLHEIWMADLRNDAMLAIGSFRELLVAMYPKAVECLERDKDALLALCDLAAEHWAHRAVRLAGLGVCPRKGLFSLAMGESCPGTPGCRRANRPFASRVSEYSDGLLGVYGVARCGACGGKPVGHGLTASTKRRWWQVAERPART